jgi:serine/threonine protein kinase
MVNASSPEIGSYQDEPLLLSVGTVLQNRYRIVCELGAGGMGAVYEAIDQRLDATIAIKETFSVDERLRRQFEQEARLLAQLHHPNLPRVSDYFIEDGRAFLVMQFIAGQDLAQMISQQTCPFPRNQVIAWADQLLDALIYLHTRDRQIIHRDIKPHNLKLTASGQIALLDFGLAKTHGSDHSTTQSSNSVFGYTRRYSPPEQIHDKGTSPQSDIYALGATLYHLLTGIKPPDALERAAALANGKQDPLKSASEINLSDGFEIAELLNKAMALNAVDRFENAIQFREALQRLGRREFDGISDSICSSLPEHDAVNATILKQPAGPRVDPFDSYSILRPEEDVFRLAKPKRTPAIMAAVFAIVLITMAASYPSHLIDSFARFLDSPRVKTSRETTSAATVHPGKVETAAAKSAANKVIPDVSSPATDHQNPPQKRRSRRSSSKPNGLKPPPFSIAP